MDAESLATEFVEVEKRDSIVEDKKFAAKILSSQEPDVVALHFELLKKRDNWMLYIMLRDAFAKGRSVAEQFLIQRIQTEKDHELQKEALHFLGYLRSKEARRYAREFVLNKNSDLRETACYVLGWVCEAGDIPLLQDRLLNDSEQEVRITAATSLDQVRMRLPGETERIRAILAQALRKEDEGEVIAWIVITLQYVMGANFGLEEVIEEGEYRGNVRLAKERASKALGIEDHS